MIEQPSYIRIEQKPSLCGPACLEMIFTRRGKPVSQEKLALMLDTKVPPGHETAYTLPIPITTDPAKAGTTLEVFSIKVPQISRQLGIPLRTTIYHMTDINNLSEFLSKHLQAGNDVMVNFKDVLNKEKSGLGHFALISKAAEENIELCDPWAGNKAFYTVSDNSLAEQINTKTLTGEKRGIVVFSTAD